jgi:hypothetical protein
VYSEITIGRDAAPNNAGDVAPNNGLRQLVMRPDGPRSGRRSSLYFRDIFYLTIESVYTANRGEEI